MRPEYWHTQDSAKPLHANMLWSRPENRLHAGKLLIIGGSEHGFAAPAEAYGLAIKNGAGSVRVALPDALRRTVGRVFPEGEYVPSTPSGSFAQTALAELLSMALWADAVLFAGDIGRNSETAIVMEKFLEKFHGFVALSGDSIEILTTVPRLLQRPDTLLITGFSQLQKVFIAGQATSPLTSQLDLLRVVEALHVFTTIRPIDIIIVDCDRTVLTASAGHVSSTGFSVYDKPEPAQLAASGTVWRMQNPTKVFDSLTTAVVAHLHD